MINNNNKKRIPIFAKETPQNHTHEVEVYLNLLVPISSKSSQSNTLQHSL